MPGATMMIAVNGRYKESELEKGVRKQLAPFMHQLDEPFDYLIPFDEDCGGINSLRVMGWRMDRRHPHRFGGLNYFRKSQIDNIIVAEQERFDIGRYSKLRLPPEAGHPVYEIATVATKVHCAEGGIYHFVGVDCFLFEGVGIFLRDYCWHDHTLKSWEIPASKPLPGNPVARTEEGLPLGKRIFSQRWQRKIASIIYYDEDPFLWDIRFYRRFIENLPNNEWLVLVDIHL